MPVLQECLDDNDSEVRLNSLILLQHVGSIRETEAALSEALNDPDPAVRLAAIDGIGRLGRDALNAIGKLSEIAGEQEPALQAAAHVALWRIDPDAAKNIGWEEIHSSKWGFSARLPIPVKQQQKAVATPYGDAPLEAFSGSIGAVQFTIAVAEYDPAVAIEFTEEQRYHSVAMETPKMLGGELIQSEPIRQSGFSGQDNVIEVPGRATLHSRVFLVGNRSYQAQVVFPSRAMLHPNAEEYFLNSLVVRYAVANSIDEQLEQ